MGLHGFAALAATHIAGAPVGLGPAERFFYAHAGYSHKPGVESPEQGRTRGAKALARAEAHASRHGWRVAWKEDRDCDPEDYEHGEDVLWARLLDGGGKGLGSLGCIVGADANYRRVVEAELALEAMGERGVARRR